MILPKSFLQSQRLNHKDDNKKLKVEITLLIDITNIVIYQYINKLIDDNKWVLDKSSSK